MLDEQGKVAGNLQAGEQVKVQLKVSLPEQMRPEVVKAIFSKIRLEGIA
jgi:hypothetical protein